MAVAVLTYISPVLHKKVPHVTFFLKKFKNHFLAKNRPIPTKKHPFPIKNVKKISKNASKPPQNTSKTGKIPKKA
jgi:hypothetical protein